MKKKLKVEELIPMQPLLDEQMLEYEAVTMNLIPEELIDKDKFDYTIYCYAYSEIQQALRNKEKQIPKYNASLRVLIASLMKITLSQWDNPDFERFQQLVQGEKEQFRQIHGILAMFEISMPNRLKNIRESLENLPDYEEINKKWEQLMSVVWKQTQYYVDSHREKYPGENPPIWESIEEKAYSLN